MSAAQQPFLTTFPGTLYDGDGTRLAGSGPELTLEMTEALPHKALIHGKPGAVNVAVLEAGDRLWLLPNSFGTPPVLPVLLLTDWRTWSGAGARSAWLRATRTFTCSRATR